MAKDTSGLITLPDRINRKQQSMNKALNRTETDESPAENGQKVTERTNKTRTEDPDLRPEPGP